MKWRQEENGDWALLLTHEANARVFIDKRGFEWETFVTSLGYGEVSSTTNAKKAAEERLLEFFRELGAALGYDVE